MTASTTPASRVEPLFAFWPLAEPEGPPPPRVPWTTETPLCFVGGWEPLSFRQRAGYAWTDEEAAFAEEFSDRALDEYRRLGATSIVIPYAKGFGHAATGSELAQERDIIERAHAKGLRVAVYVRVDALVPETVRDEAPDVDQWLTRGVDGRPNVYHPQQTWRRRVCYSHPGAVAYLESVFRYAVETLKADQLHLDGYHVAFNPASTCRCPRCVESYRQWLERRYPTPEAVRRAFGMLRIDAVEPPWFEPGGPLPVVINSPDIRAWLRFQWDRELAFTRHLRRFVRGLSDQVAISINAAQGVYYNAPLIYGQLAQRLLPWVDMIWSEDRFHLRLLEGRPISRLAIFKMAREAGLPVCAYHWAQKPKRVEASVSLALAANGGHASCLGFTFRYLPHAQLGAEAKARLTRWAREHWALLGNTQPMGEVGLARHTPSLTWNGRQPWEAVVGLEALLTRMRVPWRLMNQIDHPALDEVRTLLVAEAECLSDEELARLRSWVEAGGRLLFTTRTGRYDEDRRRRPRQPILDWVDAWRPINDAIGPEEWFAWTHEDVVELEEIEAEAAGASAQPAVAELGSGRLGWWPAVRSVEPVTPHILRARDLRPPVDADALERFIAQLHGPFTMRVDAAPQVMVEFNRPASRGGRLIHLIRIDEQDAPVEAVIHLDASANAQAAVVLSPDPQPPRLQAQPQAIRLNGLQRYAVVHLPS